MFGVDSAKEVGGAAAPVARTGTVRRHVRILSLGGLAIFVLALAGTLFGSGARRPTGEPPTRGVVTDPGRGQRPGPKPRQLRDLTPVRPAPRPQARPTHSSTPREAEPARPAATVIEAPLVAEVPRAAPLPTPPSPRSLRARPSREFDFER